MRSCALAALILGAAGARFQFVQAVQAVQAAQAAEPPAQASGPIVAQHSATGPFRAAPPSPSQRAGFTVKADVNLVLVEATVRDQRGEIVDNLAPQDFHLYEDGVEQRIAYFSRDELPLAVAIVLDSSGSMGPALKSLHRGIYHILAPLKPSDQVALFDFEARAELRVGLTFDRQRIAQGIAGIRAEGGTVIPDALCVAAEYLERAAPDRRHAIILVSDNANTLQGFADEKRAIREGLESQSVIYSIKVEQNLHPHPMYVILPVFTDVSVPTIVHQTGGEVIDARGASEIEAAMKTAITRIKERYTLGYYSTNRLLDDGFRGIDVRVSEGRADQKYTVYAREGYYARAENGFASQP